MKVSQKWLNEYVECIDKTPEELEKIFTMTGTKVEEVVSVGKFHNIVVGKILEITKHESADKLVVTKVQVDMDGKVEQIVTGATNVSVNDIIPVALVGAILPNGIEIKKGALRGVSSNGMMCSIGELGVSKNFFEGLEQIEDGIMMLPKEYENMLGMNIQEVFKMYDNIFDFEITPNRQDCQGVKAIGKELSVGLDRKFKGNVLKKEDFKNTFNIVSELEYMNKKVTVDIDEKNCNRYTLLKLEDVKISQSSKEIQYYLSTQGINSINNIVDLTNFVMLEIGQPLHSFDADKVLNLIQNDKEINFKIEQAQNGSELTLLDDTKISLENELVIKINDKNVALAGIMGGKDTSVDYNTKNVFIECANFERKILRDAGRLNQILTDALAKFEKKLPVQMIEEAVLRLLELVEKYNIAKISKDIIDVKNEKAKEYLQTEIKIPFDVDKITNHLGVDIPKEYIEKILLDLDFTIVSEQNNKYIIPPYNRSDVNNIFDLSEEVIRFYGYDKLNSTLPNIYLKNRQNTKIIDVNTKVKNILPTLGYNQIMTYGFINKKDLKLLELEDVDNRNQVIEVKNPLGPDYEIMRTTLSVSMLNTLAFNEKNQNENIQLFEVAKTYNGKDKVLENELPTEDTNLILGITTNRQKTKNVINSMEYLKYGVYKIKSDLEKVLKNIGIKNYQIVEETQNKLYHIGICANIQVGRDIIATFGKLHPQIQKNFGIKQDVFLAELNLSHAQRYIKNKIKYTEISKFPKVTRDLSLVVPKEIKYTQIQELIQKNAKKYLSNLELFDIYISEELVQQNKKSMSIRLELEDKKQTLEETIIKEIMDKIIQELKNKLGIDLR